MTLRIPPPHLPALYLSVRGIPVRRPTLLPPASFRNCLATIPLPLATLRLHQQQFSLWNLPIISNKYRLLVILYFYDTLQALSEKWEFQRNSTKNKVVNNRQKLTTIGYIVEYLIMRIAAPSGWVWTLSDICVINIKHHHLAAGPCPAHNHALEMDWAKPCRFWKAVFKR